MSMEVVNGYVCHNCTDVSLAKKSIDPAHPKDGPNGADKAKADAPRTDKPEASSRGPAVVLSGALSQAGSANAPPPANGATPVDRTASAAPVQPVTGVTPSDYKAGSTVNISA